VRLNYDIELRTPSVPNFVQSTDGHTCIDIADLTHAQLLEIAAEWAAHLVAKSDERREKRAAGGAS
jgi:hypothetical protein